MVRTAMTAALAAIAAPALAQSAAPASADPSTSTPAPAQTPAAQTGPTAGWSDGFFVQSANGEYKLNLGSIVQMDGRFALGDDKPIINTFTMRKARVIFVGSMTKYFAFRIMPDFSGGTAQLYDAYLDFKIAPALRIRTGKDKTPVGYEELLSTRRCPSPSARCRRACCLTATSASRRSAT